MSSTFNILQHDSVRQQQQESNPSTPRLQPVPSLLSWSDVNLLSATTTTTTTTTTTITPTSPSPPSSSTSSPILSPEAQAFADDIYALHSKSSWQLSLSEPTLSLDELEGRASQVVEKENSYRGRVMEKEMIAVGVMDPPSVRPKRKERRRRTLHVDIPTKHIGHTRVVEDEEPISLGEDLEREEVVGSEEAVEERGRSRVRGEARLGGGGSSLPPPSSRQDRTVLLSPPHIICQAPTDASCPYGPTCPYQNTHAQLHLTQQRHPRHPERAQEILALVEEVNAVTEALARLASHSTLRTAGTKKDTVPPSSSTSTTTPRIIIPSISSIFNPSSTVYTTPTPVPVQTSTSRGEMVDALPEQMAPLLSAILPSPPALPPSSLPSLSTEPLPNRSAEPLPIRPKEPPPKELKGSKEVAAEPLDVLGLPPHPLVRPVDLGQYTRGSARGTSALSALSGVSMFGGGSGGMFGSGAMFGSGSAMFGGGSVSMFGGGAGASAGAGSRSRAGSTTSDAGAALGGRHSRRPSGGSSSGKFAVPNIPAFKASRRGSDASTAPTPTPAPATGLEKEVEEDEWLDLTLPPAQARFGPLKGRNPSELPPWEAANLYEHPPEIIAQLARRQATVLDDDSIPDSNHPASTSTPQQPTVVKRKAMVLDDLIAEPSKPGPAQQRPPQPKVLKRKAVVLDDPMVEPSKPGDAPQSPPIQHTVIKRKSAVLDDLPEPQPSVIKRQATTLLDDLLNTPPVPAQPTPTTTTAIPTSPNTSIISSPTTSNLLPPAEIYDASGNRIIGGYPTGEKIQLHSPPLSPEELRSPPRTTRSGRLIRPGGLFNNAVAGLSAGKKKDPGTATVNAGTATTASATAAAEPAKSASKMGNSGGMFTKNQGMFSKGMFTLPMSAPLIPSSNTLEEKESRRTSQSSRSSNQNQNPPSMLSSPINDPVSPSQTSRTADSASNSSDRVPGSSSLAKMFTSPSRPLFSGYEHVVPTDVDGLPIDENLRRGAEEWLQRQREKDLRQALRLEKALDEKRTGLVKRLEWKAPLVETNKGYGYGDGLEVQQETKLATGEVYKVLTWDERFAMEKEVKKVEDSLVKVREDIVKHGGEPGQAISYVGTALAEARARARAIDEKNTREREERAAKEKEAMLAAPSPMVPEAKEYQGSQPTPSKEVVKPDQEEQGTSPTSVDKGKGREIFDFTFATPQTPEHIIKAERERALIISRLQAGEKLDIPRTGSIDIIAAYAANASPAELARLAQRVPPAVKLPEMTASARLSLPDHLRVPPSQRYGSATSPTSKEEKPPAVVKRSAIVLDDGAWSIDPPATKSESRPAPSGNGLLDLLTGAAILGGKPAKLTEQSMKRHEEMMAEDEARRVQGVKPLNELVEKMLSQPKADPPKASGRMTSPPARRPAPGRQASQESGRSMWGRWGDSPLPGTAGASDGPGSPPFQFMAPRPASSVPPPEAIARPSSVAPSAAQLMSPSDFLAAKQERRISMSTAKPGEETSTQTMEALNLDESDEDETGDDSRGYVSAEEGEDIPSAGGEDAPPRTEETPPPENEDSSHPTLQRKRSSTTSGLRVVAPVPENRHRPSPLDDWHFDFASRKSQRDLVSPGPFSSAVSTSGASMFGGRATPTRHHHGHSRRRLSQENKQFTPLFGYGVAAPNNTPDSPPPRRYEPASPTRSRPSNAERYTIERMRSPTETTSQYSDDWEQQDTPEQMEARAQARAQAQQERPYFVVTRSANVLDEAANLIEYSNARVMSGGVKIGSILPRGVNGVIEEEDEDAAELDVDFETTPVVPLAVPAVPPTTSPPLMGHQMAIPTYPLGVPVPGHPQAMSSTPLVPMPTVIGHQPQLAAASNVHHVAHPASSTAPLQKRPSLVLNAHGLHHAPHLSLPSPVTSNSGSQSHVAPVEYCGDFRTTGHCRFGARCRYSHDIEPRVRTSTSTRYRPTAPIPEPAAAPQTAVVGIPPVPAGYQLSNVLPQPHHIPGIPLSQQPASPFVFAHPSSVAHPRTSPAATAAANRGVKMSNTDKATKILKSLGITPQQLLAHQPAPTVMADGEIMYDLTQGRSNKGTFLDQEPAVPFPTGLRPDRSMKEAHDLVLMRYGTDQEKRSVMGSSAGMVVDGEEEDIWTVTRGRKSLSGEPGTSKDGQQRRASRPSERAQPVQSQQYPHIQQYQQAEQDSRQAAQYYHQQDKDSRQAAPAQMRVPASYSPVQHLQYPNPKQFQAPSQALYSTHGPSALAQYQHLMSMVPTAASVTPVTTPSPVPGASPGGGSLTQEEVIKVLTALGLSVPGLTTTPAHSTPPTASQNLYSAVPAVQPPSSHGPQIPQRPRYPPGPYDYMHPSTHH